MIFPLKANSKKKKVNSKLFLSLRIKNNKPMSNNRINCMKKNVLLSIFFISKNAHNSY